MQTEDNITPDIVRETVTKGLYRSAIWLLLVLLMVPVILYLLDEEDVYTNLVDVQWELLFVGWVCMVCTMWFLGLRWKALLNETKASNLFFSACISGGLLINYALPGPMGEIMGGWLLKREDQTPIVLGLTANTLGRLIGLFTAAVGAVSLWPWIEVHNPDVTLAMQLLLLGIGAGAVLLLALCWKAPILVEMATAKGKSEHHPIKLIGTALYQVRSLKPRQITMAFVYSMLGHGVAYLGILLSLMALGDTPSAVAILFVYLVGTCCGTVAFLFPGSQLTWDVIFTGLLISAAGYTPETAILATGVLRVEQLAMMGFGGLPLMWILLRQQKSTP